MTDAITTEPARKKAKVARGSPVKKKSSIRDGGAAAAPRAEPASAVTRVADLARTGQHAQAIEGATAALAAAGLDIAVRLDLLDLRAESFIAQGELDRARADAAAMLKLATIAKRRPALKAQALNRQALVQMRKGELEAAVATATAALKSARQSKQSPLIATSLFRLAEAQYREKPGRQVLRNAMEAAELFRTLGDASGEGRALWVVAMYRGYEGRAAEGNRAASDALALCRSCGDLYGAGNALNMLLFHEADLATALRLSSLALADFEAAGYIDRQAIVTGNRGITYASLGLHRRARRLYLKAGELHRRAGAKIALGNLFSSLCEAEMAMGHFENARAYVAELAGFADALPGPLYAANLGSLRGRLALLEGDAATALRHFEPVARIGKDTNRVAIEIDGLTSAGEAYLALGKPRAALTATRRAAEMHKAHDLAALDGMSPAATWWRYSQALRLNKKTEAAREALETAYGFVLKGIAGLSDEGLRRNYLNKNEVHREIVTAWLADAGKRRLSRERRTAHLAGEANLREPFERLVETGLRLNELRSADELHEFLIDEATELSGAERVLFVLETPEGLRLAGSLVPRGEDGNELLRVSTPALTDVRRTRAARLAHVPDGASELEQRSRVIAPLIAQRQLLGYLYADLDGAFGRFRESDRDLLGMLASQAAVALDNAQWSQGLEQKVAQRTGELEASNALLEQRANELAIINSIQEGMAAELNFQAIVDLVGDKLREVFRTGDIGIRWHDAKANLMHYLYEYEHGVRLSPVSHAPQHGGAFSRMQKTRSAIVMKSRADATALGIGVVPGTDVSQSGIMVPILGGDRVLGLITLENYERENAFGESEVRLLSTVAASMGVALENARLFDETQRLFKAEQERAAELQIINSIQQGLAAELDFQAIVDLVGDKLREVFGTPDLGITWYDDKANLLHYLYAYEHGKRLTIAPRRPQPGGIFETEVNTRQPVVINTVAEQAALNIYTIPGTDQSKSSVSVPIISSDRVLGDISLDNFERENAYGESELRLLTTIAASLGTALENARLFDETQRLLKETEQRAAELAIINSVQEGLASKLDMQAIYDLVGNKLSEVLNSQDIDIRLYDPATNRVSYPFVKDRGRRIAVSPTPLGGVARWVIESRQTWLVNEDMERRMAEIGSINIPGTQMEKSFIAVPIIAGDRVLGLVGIGNYEREHAFSDSDVRLLQTVVSAMSVALENARLFDETQRLLKETEQRAAELAVINSIQEGMAAELDFQAIVDLVGDKLREVLKTGEIGIRWYDAKTKLVHYLYEYEHGERLTIASRAARAGRAWYAG